MEMWVDAIVWYAAFVFSATLHEAAHAAAARLGGDPTAYEGGQVSIDPIPHIRREPFGMVVLPLVSLFVMGWPLGFASAPYDPTWADRHPRRAAWMSLAGPAANLLLVVLCAGAIWGGVALGELDSPERAFHAHVVEAVHGGIWGSFAFIVSVAFTLNLILFVFNLIPLPPLDGSGALGLLLGEDQARRLRELTSNPMFAIAGMMIAWYAFGAIFEPIFLLSLNLLYPGADYR
ncbi:MAG: site-2 protease family protein [Myxococcota bacterium]